MNELDIAVARALDLPMFTCAGYTFVDGRHDWSPSTNWADGGPLIERYQISLLYLNNGTWRAGEEWYSVHVDASPLVAAMRVLCSTLMAPK